MKFKDWLKEKLNLEKLSKFGLSKKTMINLVVLFCIGITLLIISDFYKDLYKNENNSTQIDNANDNINNNSMEQKDNANISTNSSDVDKLEEQLSAILSKIQDAGAVSVMITLESSSEFVPAKDESVSDKVTNEKDLNGGTRIINELNTNDKVVFKNTQEGNSEPLIVKEINPQVKGVIVVAEGAKNPKVKLKLTQAVQTVLDIPAYRVTVYEGVN